MTKKISPEQELSKQLSILIKEIKITNSLKHKFLLSLVTGLGTVIGATVLVALLIFILSKLATIEVIKPFVENVVEIVQTAKR